MVYYIKRVLLPLVFIFQALCPVYSQGSYSPYSIFGAGQIEASGFGVTRAMGGAGIAMRSNRWLNNMNPASYTAIDSLNFMFEAGLYFNYSNFETNKDSQSMTDGNIEYIAIAYNVAKFWGFSVGLVPYSKIAYSINGQTSINGEPTSAYNLECSGKGRINKFYIGNSFLIAKNLSVGFNVLTLFGNIDQTEEASGEVYYLVNYNKYFRAMHLDFGAQYIYEINDKKSITIGAIYSRRKKIDAPTDISITDQTTVEIKDSEAETFIVPEKLGLGMAFVSDQKWQALFDYEIEFWENSELKQPYLDVRNSERFSFGFSKDPIDVFSRNIFKQIYYHFGAKYYKSYMLVDDVAINAFSLSFGLSVPVNKKQNTFNLSFEYGQNGSKKSALVKEKYWQFNLSISMRDIFRKSRYY